MPAPEIPAIIGRIFFIFNLVGESRRLNEIHHSKVMISSVIGELSCFRNRMLENYNDVFNFRIIMDYFRRPDSIMIHVPEYPNNSAVKNLAWKQLERLRGIPYVRIKMLNQEINLMPASEQLRYLENSGTLSSRLDFTCYAIIFAEYILPKGSLCRLDPFRVRAISLFI